MGAKKPKAQAKPDPATIATSPGENARKQQELENRRRSGFYSGFKKLYSGSVGDPNSVQRKKLSNNQTVG